MNSPLWDQTLNDWPSTPAKITATLKTILESGTKKQVDAKPNAAH
jgi:hypothetical protein